MALWLVRAEKHGQAEQRFLDEIVPKTNLDGSDS